MGPPFAPIHGGDSAIEQSFGMLGGLRLGCVTMHTLIKPLQKRGAPASSQTTDLGRNVAGAAQGALPARRTATRQTRGIIE